jgi:hypothetical protein
VIHVEVTINGRPCSSMVIHNDRTGDEEIGHYVVTLFDYGSRRTVGGRIEGWKRREKIASELVAEAFRVVTEAL